METWFFATSHCVCCLTTKMGVIGKNVCETGLKTKRKVAIWVNTVSVVVKWKICYQA
jgi:hypothetical protein